VLAIKKASDLHKIFKYRSEKTNFVSSHRGGPLPGFPENCIETFENTLKYTYAILEIDPRYTKDSLMVLHHDPVLGRTADGEGPVIKYTLAELQKMNLRDSEGNITDLHMPSFAEALDWAKGKTVLVVDQKDVSAKARKFKKCRS
jgi:glycerophosphoryl diester phosphodiesterase